MSAQTSNERTVAAWVDRRSAPCFHHALLLQRAELRTWDDPTADPILQSLLKSLAGLQLDDEARELGLHRDHLAAIRFAIVALLDECAAHQPGSERWRERLFDGAGLPRSANVGHEFFVALEQRLAVPAPTPADLAVLQVHAVCLFLGLRGRYGAHVEAAESELQHQLRRLHLKLRPLLAPRAPPTFPPPPLTHPRGPSRTTLHAAALLLISVLALVASLRNSTFEKADLLRSHLGTPP
jgi:type IV/VI secretion system ImpK/VasF family protein